METHPTLYKRDTLGNVRIWYMEIEGNKYRSTSGVIDGQHVTTNWTITEGKNVGRANATTPVEQAQTEVAAEYKKRLEGEYHKDVNDIDKARFFKPMLAKKWEDFRHRADYSYSGGVFVQPKLDGIRCLASVAGLYSRTGKPIVACPHVYEALKPVWENPAFEDIVFDGELYNHELRDDFNSIVSAVRKQIVSDQDLELSARLIEYHIYDVYSSFDPEWRFSSRHNWLVDALAHRGPPLVYVYTTRPANHGEVDLYSSQFLNAGYEGTIVRFNGPYEQKRSGLLLKYKQFMDEEFEIVRVEEGLGNWSGYAKRVVCKLPDGREFGAGLKGTQEEAKAILAVADQYIGKQAAVKFFNYTPDGIPRFPIAHTLYREERW